MFIVRRTIGALGSCATRPGEYSGAVLTCGWRVRYPRRRRINRSLGPGDCRYRQMTSTAAATIDHRSGSDRGKRLFTIAVVAVAAVAALASSPDDEGSWIDARPASGTVTLTPDRPEVRIPFVVEASAEADDWGLGVLITIPSIWVGEGDPALTRGPDASVEDQSGEVKAGTYGRNETAVSCDIRCLGSNELVLRWPDELPDGSLTVDWTIAATMAFATEEPPDGAAVTLVAEASDPTSGPVAAWTIGVDGNRPMLVGDFHVVTTAPLAPGVLRVQRRTDQPGDPAFVQIQQSIEWSDLPPGRGIEIVVPAACDHGPCEFDIRTSASVASLAQYGVATVELFASGVDESVEATLVESESWRSSPGAADTTVFVDPATDYIPISINVEVSGEIDGATPVFYVSYSVELIDPGADDVAVSVGPEFEGTRHLLPRVRVSPGNPTGAGAFALAAECDGDRCYGSAIIGALRGLPGDPIDTTAEVGISVEAVFLSPAAVGDAGPVVVGFGET